MSDNNTVSTNALNTLVDERIRSHPVTEEQYTKADEGSQIANKPLPLSDTAATTTRSWALAEIERTVAEAVLPAPKQRLSHFGMNLTRKSDFRLQDITRKLDRQIRTEFAPSPNQPRARRISDFEVRSHSLRLISTNATLGSYQFQKTTVLPFMRKSLALDFQRTSLLKQVVGGISGMEKAIVSKLEAIKLNTAAAAPTKQSLFTRLKLAVRDKQIDRVAGNVANVMMDRHAKTWRQYVSPVLTKLNQVMQTPGPRGGFNGASRGLTKKLNSLRHSLMRSNEQSLEMGDDGTTPVNKSKFAAIGSRVLGGAMRIGQRVKLSSGLNTMVSKPLSNATDFLSKLDPFSGGQIDKNDIDELGDDLAKSRNGGMSNRQFNTMYKLLRDWRKETGERHHDLLTHLSSMRSGTPAINQATSPAVKLNRRLSRMGSAPSSMSPNNLSGVNGWRKLTAQSATVSFQDGQAIQTTLIGSMTDQLAAINTSIQQGNQSRSLYERVQTKRQQLADKLMTKLKVRKGSYEDLLAQRANRKKAGPSDQLKATAAAVLQSVQSGGTGEGATGGKNDGFSLSDLFDMGGDDSKDTIKNKAKSKASRGWRRAKIGMKRGFRQGGIKGGAKGLFKMGLRGLWGGAKGASKLGGKGIISAAGTGGKSLFNLATGTASAGVLLGVGRHFLGKSDLDKSAKGELDTLMAAGEYGLMGASVGGMFGGAGAVPGAVIGAAAGAIIANADYAAKGLAAIGNGSVAAVSGLWSTIFGQKAVVREDGTVVRKEKSSLLEDIKIAFVGRKARYSASGQLIASERSNILGNIQYGFEKTLFGDRFSNGEFKSGTSIIEMARDGIESAVLGFRDQLTNLPNSLKEGFKKGTLAKSATWAMTKAEEGAKGTRQGLASLMGKQGRQSGPATVTALTAAAAWLKNSTQNITMDKAKQFAGSTSPGFWMSLGNYLTPTGFAMGLSNATYGWWLDSAEYDNPASAQYKFVDICLNAYGVKNRTLYKFIHSLETSQEKINKGQAKPFQDEDMAFMASRFGFDPKNSDAVNYFKLWYSRRFLAAMAVIDKTLKSKQRTFADVFASDDKQVNQLNDELKRAIAGSGVLQLGMEPSPQAYNRYAKIGTSDPGGVPSATLNKDKPFDPRDPSNRAGYSSFDIASNATTRGSLSGGGGGYSEGFGDYGSMAAHKRAAMAPGGVKDQPEFKAAYQILPPNIKKVVNKSRPLQFVLWSTSIQHGAKGAALIFERDYSDQLDESGYLRSIYQDRSRSFGNLSENDRAQAVAQLGKEQRFAFGIQNNTSNLSRGSMQSMVGDMIDPTSTVSAEFAAVKKVIQGKESRGNYNIAVYGTPTPKPLTSMTLGEVFDWQRGPLRAKTRGRRGPGDVGSTGVGAYQFESLTLKSMAEKRFGPDWRSQMFTPQVQDQLAERLYNTVKGNPKALRATWFAFDPAHNGGRSTADVINNARRSHAMAVQQSSMESSAAMAQAAPAPARAPVPQQPPARPAPQRPKPVAKPAPAPKHDQAQWANALSGMADHAKALRENTEAMRSGMGPLKQTGNNTIVSPVIMNNKSNDNGFISMSMQKSMLVTGK